MSPEAPDQRQNPGIDPEQGRIEKLNRMQGDESEKIKKTFIDRVNQVQSRIRQLRTQADILKNMKKENWQKVEATCAEQEKKLLKILRTVLRPDELKSAAEKLESTINESLQTLSSLQPETANTAPDARARLEKTMDVFGKMNEEARAMEQSIQEELKKIGEKMKNVPWLERMTPEWMRKPGVKSALRGDFSGAGIEIGTGSTQKDMYRESVKNSIERIKHYSKILDAKQTKLGQVAAELIAGDIAVSRADVDQAYKSGDKETGNRMLLKLWEKYGVALKQVDPELWDDIGRALGELKQGNALSEFEQKLYGKEYSYDDAMKVAIAEHQKISGELAKDTDIIDQLKSGSKVSVSGYALPKGVGGYSSIEGGYRTIKTQTGETFEGVGISNEALRIIDRNPNGVVFLKKPTSIQFGPSNSNGQRGITKLSFVDAKDLAYAHLEDKRTKLIVEDPLDPEKKRTSDVGALEKNRDERTQDVLRCIDRDPVVTAVVEKAATMNRGCQTVQTLFAAGMEGLKYQEFVDFSRTGANELLAMLEDPTTLQNARAAREKLVALKGISLGVAHGGLEVELDARIKAIDGFVQLLGNDQLRAAIETIRDKSKWSADTWYNWCTIEGPRILAAIVLAVAVTMLVITTCGITSPVGVLLVTASVGTAGGMIGSDAVKEIQHWRAQYDADVVSGSATYTDPSRLGMIFGEKIRDPKTGELRTMRDIEVLNSYTAEFVTGFATTCATMGASQVTGKTISEVLKNGRVLQALNKYVPTLQNIIKRMQRVEQVMGPEKANTANKFVKAVTELSSEIREELTDEAVEAGTKEFLNSVQGALTQAEEGFGWGDYASFIVGTIQNIKPGKVNVMKYQVGIDPKAIMAELQKNNFVVQVDTQNPSVLLVSSISGLKSFRVEPDTEQEVATEPQSKVFDMSGISPDAVTSSSLMSTQNRELFFVVNHDGTDTLVRATVKNIEEKDGRWTFVMEGRLPDGSPFTSTFSERAESDAEGFTYVEGVKILDQGAARAFALQNKMAIAESETNDSSDQRKLLNPEIEERLSRLRDRSERVVASLPEIPPGHTRVFRGITGEYKPKQPLSPAEQQELSKLRTLLGEGKLSPEQGNRFGELHTRNTPEMCGDDLLLVLRAYADAPDATLMYADIDLKQRPDIDIEHRGASGNFYIPPPGSMEWKMIPRTVLNAEGTAEQKSDAPLSKTVQLTPQEIGLIRVEKGWDSTNTGFRYEYTVDGYKFSINYPNWVSGFATEEHIIVNAMIAHNKGALELGIDPYRTLRAEEWEGDSLMINGGDLFNLKKFQSHLQEQRSQGFSDQDLAHYYAGHMIHETLHEPGTATKDNLLHGQHPIGEYTTITGQFAYYLSQGYFGDYSYEAPLYDSGTRIIQKAKDYGPFDYDPATSVAADLINNRLVETFPEESKGLETLDAITRCKEIGKRIPKERHGEFVAALQKAIGDSANKQMVAQATVDSAHRSTQLLSSGKLLAQNVREATVTGEANTQEKIVKDMKEFMKSNYVYSNARIQMAEALLGRTLEKNERNSILKAHNLPGVIDQLSPEELSAKTKELSKGITDPVERRLLIEAGICGEPSIDSKRASEDITKNLEGEQYEYAFRKIQRLQQAGRPESEVLPLAEEVIRAALLKGSRNQEDSYPSLEFSKKKEYVQVDSQGMKTDRRHFYKYDLIKSLNLPPAEHDRIISSVLDEMLADLEKQIPSRGYDSYSGTLRVDDALLLRIGEIQYHIPITSPDVLAKFQAKVRALAPSILIRGDIYPLQEIGNAFGVRWHTERHQYAKQACVQLLTQASTMTERDIGLARIPKALVTLQEEYEVPLPDTDRQGVLKIFAACVGNSGDVPDRFVKAFSLTPAETKAAAIATCTGALEYSLSQPPSSYPENQAYEGNHLYVHALAKKYGISPSELGPLAPEVQKLHEAIVSDKGIDSFTKDLQKSQLKNYLPDFIQAETESALRSKDRSHLQKLQNACAISPELSKLYTQSINTIFSTDQSNDQLLDLNVEHNRALWLVLISKNETRKRAGQECDNFLASKGLDPHKMRLAWKQSSNNRTEKMPGSEKTYKEFMGTDLVYARNIARVAQLEQAQPGITKHLSDRWGIHMFTRYPNNILLRQYRQDKEPADNTKKKQTVLVLFPQSDWNGAFEREDLIKDIAKQSPESTHNLCIAESGQRYGCVRRVARAAQDFGPIDRLVLGGHSDGNTIHFGPNPDDSFSKENLQVNKENKEEYERQKTVIDRVRSYMAPDGKITLKACSTGKEGGIAQQITQTFEIDVHGPLVPSGIANIDIKTGTATHVADGKYSPTKQYVKPTWFEKMKTQLSKFWPFGKKTETKKEDDGTWHPHDSKEEPQTRYPINTNIPAPPPPPENLNTPKEPAVTLSGEAIEKSRRVIDRSSKEWRWGVYPGKAAIYETSAGIVSLLGEVEAMDPDDEVLIVNALLKQGQIGELFNLPEDMIKRGFKVSSESRGTMMMSNTGELYLEAVRTHVRELREQGVSDADIATELAGHIFHESVHDSTPEGETRLYKDGHSSGEISTITAQTAYYLTQGYEGPTSYNPSDVPLGEAKIRGGSTSQLDYEVATYYAAEFIYNRLVERFPDLAATVSERNPLEASRALCRMVPKSQRPELIAALQDAIADSGSEDAKATRTVESGKRLAEETRTNQGTENEKQTVEALKIFMKSYDVHPDARIQMAESLLGRTLGKNERDAVLNAHNLPGVIDRLTPDELRAKTEELSKGITDLNERRVLIETGICGNKAEVHGVPNRSPLERLENAVIGLGWFVDAQSPLKKLNAAQQKDLLSRLAIFEQFEYAEPDNLPGGVMRIIDGLRRVDSLKPYFAEISKLPPEQQNYFYRDLLCKRHHDFEDIPGWWIDAHGKFDPVDPPPPVKSQRRMGGTTCAVMTKDGTVYYARNAGAHISVIQRNGLNIDDVIDGGWIRDGKYFLGETELPEIRNRENNYNIKALADRANRVPPPTLQQRIRSWFGSGG